MCWNAAPERRETLLAIVFSSVSHWNQGLAKKKLDELKERQIDTVRYLDGVFEQLYDTVPKNTHIIVTADHGELFGEAGYFGHGPIMHEKCFEVPFVEGFAGKA